MSDEKTFTKADVDAAVAAATAKLDDKVEELSNKYSGAIDDLKKAQREARAAKDITPESHQAEVERADKAEAALAEANKALKAANTEREKAAKALEAEQGAARSFALEAELASAIAEGNVVPALVPAFKAMVQQQAKAELVDGKYTVQIGDKPARDYIKTLLESDDGKHFRAASLNGGGGAPGSGGAQSASKTVTRAEFDGMSHPDRASFAKEGGKVVDQAA